MNWLDMTEPGERLLGRALRRQAEKIPEAPFLLSGDARRSYGQVNEIVNSYAHGLRELGVEHGDTVAFFMESAPECVFAALALNKLGAVWVPTNVDYKATWLSESFRDSRARILIADEALLPRVASVAEGLPFQQVLVQGRPDPASLALPQAALSELQGLPAKEPDDAALHYGDTAAILWTSGTTGRSKGVMQSHNVWIKAAINGAITSELHEGEVLYSCLPMYQSAAWVANVFRALVTGVPCAIDPRFSATDFWDRCRHYGATMTFTLGAMHIFLWNAPERPDDADNPVRTASMIPMPEPLERPFKQRFGIERIIQGYGQSEVMTVMNRRPDQIYKPNSLGAPADGIEVKLLDDEDFEVPTGEVGEMCVRPGEPYAIFNGYFENPEATLRAFRNLWYHTGDLARRDEDGEFFFVDRKADFIRFGGRNISSFAVEATAGAHPAVETVAAHGVVSAELEAEAELKIVVVRKSGQALDAETLARFINENAPHFFVPRYIEFVDELPMTPTGRVQKFKLRERGVTPDTWDARAAGFVVQRD